MSALRHEQSFEIDSFLVRGSVWKWRGRANRCCYAFGPARPACLVGSVRIWGAATRPAPADLLVADEVVSARGASFERCTIAIADSVAAPMVEGADHNGAMSDARSINFAIVVYSCMRLSTCICPIFGITEGNMAKKAKKAKKTAKEKK
jgi:hypothetical protein